MKKLMLLTSSFPPALTGETPALIKMCRYLPGNMWEPVVLAVPPGAGIPRDEGLGGEIPDSIRIDRVPGAVRRSTLPPVIGSLVQMPDSLASLRKAALDKTVKAIGESGPKLLMPLVPSHTLNLIARDASKKTGVPLVPYFRSLWTANPCAVWASGLQKLVHRLLEARVVRDSAAIVVTSEGASGYFMQRYPGSCPPLHVTENAYDPRRISPASPVEKGDTLRLGWIGGFRGARSPERVLLGLDEFHHRNPDARIRVEHAGNVSRDYRPLMESRKGTIHLRGVIPYGEVPGFLASCHVLLLSMAPGKDSHRTNPTVAAECLRTGRAILAVAPEGDMSQRLRSMGNAYVCPPDPMAFAATLENVYDHWRKSILRTPRDQLKISEHLDGSITMKLLAEFLNSVTG